MIPCANKINDLLKNKEPRARQKVCRVHFRLLICFQDCLVGVVYLIIHYEPRGSLIISNLLVKSPHSANLVQKYIYRVLQLPLKFIHTRFFIYSLKVWFYCTTNSEPCTIKTNLG